MSANETASALKLHPCHFCGRQPALVEEDNGFYVRCQCVEEHAVSTSTCSTSEQAAAEWNRMNEPCEAPFPSADESVQHSIESSLKSCPFCGKISKQHVPFGLFLSGTFLFSVGCGFFDNSVAAFMSAFGASVATSSLFLPWAWDRAEQESLPAAPVRQCASVSVTLRPDLPSCSHCGEVPSLHKTVSGRFRVQCSDSRCWPTSKNRFVRLTEQGAAAAWIEAQK
jgi:hypothetical protein